MSRLVEGYPDGLSDEWYAKPLGVISSFLCLYVLFFDPLRP